MPIPTFATIPIGTHFYSPPNQSGSLYVKTSDTHAAYADRPGDPFPLYRTEDLIVHPTTPPALPRTAAPIFPAPLLRFYRNPSTALLRHIGQGQAQRLTRLPIQDCKACEEPTFCHELQHTAGQDMCEDCASEYSPCAQCGAEVHEDDTTTVGDDTYCQQCTDDHLFACAYCGEHTHEEDGTYTEDGSVCEPCVDYYYWCETCETYSREECDCNRGCDCEAPHQHFTFPANGAGTVQQDERMTVTLPTGTVDEEGLARIRILLYEAGIYNSRLLVGDVGPEWQTRRGNMTRRISSALHKRGKGEKLTPEQLSKIGNIARQHSADQATYHVEFTRDLNRPAKEFANEESCWWESYYRSRCSLKSWGGLAIRSYQNEDKPAHRPDGRAWIQPLTADLEPTSDTTTPHAYLVYNGYEDLEGYTAARIVAHLTGMTYRKVRVPSRGEDWYVNSSVGYLISDAATTADTAEVSFPYDCHYTP